MDGPPPQLPARPHAQPAAQAPTRILVRAARAAAWTVLALLVFGIVPTLSPVRQALTAPLVVHDEEARGDAVYVMDGGAAAVDERLRGAADLYHMSRAPRIYLRRSDVRGPYSFVEKRSLTRSEWMIAYLGWRGVPRDRVTLIRDEGDRTFGSLHEADLVRDALPPEVHRLVVVTSPPHTRRCALAFRRRLAPVGVEVVTYAAEEWQYSVETYAPLWLEYGKLLVYFFVA